LQSAWDNFYNENYFLKAILRDDNKLFLHIGIIDADTNLPGSIDFRGKAAVVISDTSGREVASSPITGVASAEFDYQGLGPHDYVAKLKPLSR